jgi:hypothetical protein
MKLSKIIDKAVHDIWHLKIYKDYDQRYKTRTHAIIARAIKEAREARQ